MNTIYGIYMVIYIYKYMYTKPREENNDNLRLIIQNTTLMINYYTNKGRC